MKLKFTRDQAQKFVDTVKTDVLAGDTSWDSVLVQIRDSNALPDPCPYSHSHTRNWCGHVLCRAS